MTEPSVYKHSNNKQRIDNKVFRPIPEEADPLFKHLQDLKEIPLEQIPKLKRLIGRENFIVGLVIFKSYLAEIGLSPIGQIKRDKILDQVFLCLLSSDEMSEALNGFKERGQTDTKMSKFIDELIDLNQLFQEQLAGKDEREYRAHRMEFRSRTSSEQSDYSKFLSSFFISFEKALRESNLEFIKGFLELT